MKNNGININISSEEDVFGRGIFSLINAVGFDNEKLFKITTFFVNSFITNLQSFQFVLFPLSPTMKKYIPTLFL